VILYRLDREKGIFLGRSKCPKCQKLLQWYDLIPLISFLFLKGKCRYCGQHISFVYPAVELFTGVIFVLFYRFAGLPLDTAAAYYFILLLFFIPLIFFDYLYFIIPDKIIIPLIGLSFAFALIFRREELISLLTLGLVLGGFFAILYLASKGRWVGLGDAKLAFLIGLAFGYPPAVLIMVFSVWIAALAGILIIIFRKGSLKSELPFGTFLSIISIIYIIFQNEIQSFNIFFY